MKYNNKDYEWDKHDFNLVPLTKEFIDSLDAYARSTALEAYHDWLKRQRKIDEQITASIYLPVEKLKNREYNRERLKVWREENPEKNKAIRKREYQARKKRGKRNDVEAN
jgi:hypothetical protein